MPTAPPANGGRPGDLGGAKRPSSAAASAYGIPGVAERPAEDLPRTPADERVAPDAALLGGLEQERRARSVAQLQERRDGRLAVVDERLAAPGSGCAARPARRPPARDGSSAHPGPAGSAPATAIEHPLGVGEGQATAPQQDGEVVERRRRPPRPRARRTPRGRRGRPPRPPPGPSRRPRRLGQQLGGVGAVGSLAGARGDRALQRREHLVGSRGLELAAVKAGALAGVTGRAGRLHQRQQRVPVAVVADRPHRLGVAGGGALVPQLLARAAEEVRSPPSPG